MKWPFVRRSKYEEVRLERNDNYLKSLELECENKLLTEEINRLNQENQSLTEDIGKLINDTNRLNQELASELNSHRETRETKNKVIESNLNQIRGLEGFFEREFNLHKETKDALKIAQEDLRIYKGLVKSNKESIKYYLEKAINYL